MWISSRQKVSMFRIDSFLSIIFFYMKLLFFCLSYGIPRDDKISGICMYIHMIRRLRRVQQTGHPNVHFISLINSTQVLFSSRRGRRRRSRHTRLASFNGTWQTKGSSVWKYPGRVLAKSSQTPAWKNISNIIYINIYLINAITISVSIELYQKSATVLLPASALLSCPCFH